ncbi:MULTISPECIES: GntR family transcriptional regulator [unclassified Ruegeria]|uniref:GntR family transcriptional regulator n=1 Tax=unclassified Ruegeria TaxID=2625375 RepID=UPI001491B301|nr:MULTISPECIES: GntR family transcriptional regulator [unclassified Ruegeria]NOC47222.1 FCD domain-containing protein [Ruegeria sp. HKCCD7559]NOD86200.1 FCD domain-containing protein [Ruegeria sp. HKCCD6119]
MDLIKNKASASIVDKGKQPAHEQVYQTLRSQILFGELVPGQPVTIQGLTDSLGVGMTPVREAIRRLISDGALVFQGNRRVSVPLLSPGDIQEMIFARTSIESELSRRATSNLQAEDIDHLERLDTHLDRMIADGDVGGYLRLNQAFHETLYSHANAPILSDLAERLWLRFGPSLRVVCGRFGTQSLPDRHKDIISALREGDAEKAAKATAQDIEQGMELMSDALTSA